MTAFDRETAYADFKRLGFNSSHFVWFLADLDFLKTRSGYVFAFKQVGEVTLFALEPLIPDGAAPFDEAWAEVVEKLKPSISAFVSIYEPFRDVLHRLGFQNIPLGVEPWIKLPQWMPKGNSGRGVRSAKNFAIRAGLFVEEWTPLEIQEKPEYRAAITEVYRDWTASRWLSLEGFTLSTDPFQRMEDRRYFAVRSKKRVEGYSVASPVPKSRSYYLEDMVLRRDATKGAGELLALGAFEALDRSGAYEASLGVIPTAIPLGRKLDIPPLFRLLLVTIPSLLRVFYGFEGMKLFRKRFKPDRWDEVYFAVANHRKESRSDTAAWFKASAALFRAFRPRLTIRPRFLLDTLLHPFRRYPVTSYVAITSIVLFKIVNHGGGLPESVLSKFGFSAATPFAEWFYRSIISDLLYFDAFHFYSCLVPYLLLLIWAERRWAKTFFIPFFIAATLFDDFLNYAVVILPFKHLPVHLFTKLVSEKQVGGSLVMVMVAGLQITKIRKNRELLFVGASIATIVGAILISDEVHLILINLNHFFFLSFGFIVGKLKFEWDRKKNREHVDGKRPVPN